MKSMNGKLNLPGIQKVMMEFERESEIMDMKEEMMNDVIDDVMDDEMNEEEETDLIVSQVLDEIGISLDQSVNQILTRANLNSLSKHPTLPPVLPTDRKWRCLKVSQTMTP